MGSEFLIWKSAEEFKEDFEIGCEYIGEALEGSIFQVLGLCHLCLPRFHKRKSEEPLGSGKRGGIRSASHRSVIRIVPLKQYGLDGDTSSDTTLSDNAASSAAGGSLADFASIDGGASGSLADFFSD